LQPPPDRTAPCCPRRRFPPHGVCTAWFRVLSRNLSACPPSSPRSAALPAQFTTHENGNKVSKEWSKPVERVLRGRLVRKRRESGGVGVVYVGKVVGCESGRLFQIAYDDETLEERTWYDLRPLLVPWPERDEELNEVMSKCEAIVRASGRRRKARDLDEECEQYLPRLGCHFSLPPGKIACHLHEEARRAGNEPFDCGPAVSD
jgi:hypothetical protein